MKLKSFIELRTAAGLTQEQLARRMHMSRTPYQKLEAGHTVPNILHLQRLAAALQINMSNLYTFSEQDTPRTELQFMRQSMESMIYSRLGAVDGYDERIPFDELEEHDWDWLRFNGIETKAQYEAAPTFVSRTSDAAHAVVFAKVVQDMDIYSWFHHGLIHDEMLVKWWNEHQATYEPYFTFETTAFGRVIKRNEIPALAEPGLTLPSPSPQLEQLQGESEEFWQVIQQQSTAQHIAFGLHEAVYGTNSLRCETLQATLSQDKAAYNRTLTRLIGLAWITPDLSAEDVVFMEERRLQSGEADPDGLYAEAAGRWPQD
ncbi:helix-turn-helix domain-containing protein [Hymenobacter mucosus]|uniref:helix-turn-helix domain-containing protein n=1 Tax=Hymenobacter mucosus TaxID=1411120 RepID=UPI0015C632C8|nr:helix-turn-helix transcriptional regulator [Hymenobacter mucosus]